MIWFRKKECSPVHAQRHDPWERRYFIRTLQYDYLNEQEICVFGAGSPTLLTGWERQVFLQADGQKTAREYVKHLLESSRRPLPLGHWQGVRSALAALQRHRFVVQLDRPATLPYYLRFPQSALNAKRAAALMKDDGFIAPSGRCVTLSSERAFVSV